jgi:PIN domain nuclease of toxin-antitoxin system
MATAWEMQIKLQLDKLHLRLSLAEVIASQQQINDLQVLPVALSHVLALQSLPAHHKDPFDRLLIAQANAEETMLISHDPVFAHYPVKVLW